MDELAGLAAGDPAAGRDRVAAAPPGASTDPDGCVPGMSEVPASSGFAGYVGAFVSGTPTPQGTKANLAEHEDQNDARHPQFFEWIMVPRHPAPCPRTLPASRKYRVKILEVKTL